MTTSIPLRMEEMICVIMAHFSLRGKCKMRKSSSLHLATTATVWAPSFIRKEKKDTRSDVLWWR